MRVSIMETSVAESAGWNVKNCENPLSVVSRRKNHKIGVFDPGDVALLESRILIECRNSSKSYFAAILTSIRMEFCLNFQTDDVNSKLKTKLRSQFEFDENFFSYISSKAPWWTIGHQGVGVMLNHMLVCVGVQNS